MHGGFRLTNVVLCVPRTANDVLQPLQKARSSLAAVCDARAPVFVPESSDKMMMKKPSGTRRQRLDPRDQEMEEESRGHRLTAERESLLLSLPQRVAMLSDALRRSNSNLRECHDSLKGAMRQESEMRSFYESSIAFYRRFAKRQRRNYLAKAYHSKQEVFALRQKVQSLEAQSGTLSFPIHRSDSLLPCSRIDYPPGDSHTFMCMLNGVSFV